MFIAVSRHFSFFFHFFNVFPLYLAIVREFLGGFHLFWKDFFTFLTLPIPIPDKEKTLTQTVNLHTSLWCLKMFYEGLKGLSWFLFYYKFLKCTGQKGLMRALCSTWKKIKALLHLLQVTSERFFKDTI